MRGDPGRERVPCRGGRGVTGRRARGMPRATGGSSRKSGSRVMVMMIVVGVWGGGGWEMD